MRGLVQSHANEFAATHEVAGRRGMVIRLSYTDTHKLQKEDLSATESKLLIIGRRVTHSRHSRSKLRMSP